MTKIIAMTSLLIPLCSIGQEVDNYEVKCTKLVETLYDPTDAVLIDNELFILEYGCGRRQGQSGKLNFPNP